MLLRNSFRPSDDDVARVAPDGDLVVGRCVVEHEIADGDQITDSEKLVQEVESEGDGGHLIFSCVCWKLAS